ncbi:MAG: hypothetical protein Q8R39_03090 [bacterium]|nr:hypothetical protein [bacterium]MDZ4284459.1 hypothetical protein [Patescibacteria group bacterium]
MDKTYTTFVNYLSAEHQWGAHALFTHCVPIEERVQQCEALLVAALGGGEGEQARQYIGWLMRASDDCHLVPVATLSSGTYNLPETEEVQQARERALIARVDLAMRLYTLVPGWIMSWNWHWNGKIEALSKTMPTLLREITTAWRDSVSEKESDRIFAFLNTEGLLQVGLPENFKPELRAMIQEAVREVTDRRFPAGRLGRHLALLRSDVGYGEQQHLSEIRRLLAIAWARNSDFERLQLVVQATDALPGKSKAAFRLLRTHAEYIAALERDNMLTAAQAE